jgi:hypothetical protein
MIFLLLLVLNVFLVMIQAKAINLSEQSPNRAMLRFTEVLLGLHLFICAGSLLLKITYNHSLAMMAAALPVAIGGILSVVMTVLPKTIKFRYPRISLFRNDRKIIFD